LIILIVQILQKYVHSSVNLVILEMKKRRNVKLPVEIDDEVEMKKI
jgi:hypothetical protein